MLATNTFEAGMNQDVLEKYQKDGTYRFALNGVLENTDGGLPAITNEVGNEICATNLPAGKKVIGQCQLENTELALFLYDPSISEEHEIGVFNSRVCRYETIAKGSCLNFSDKHPINALFRLRNNKERVVYFTDDYNRYRIANLTSTKHWVDTNKDIIDCEYIKYTRDFLVPTVNIPNGQKEYVKDSGGNLEYGTYAFYLRYLDAEENPTPEWIALTHFMPVFWGPQDSIETTMSYGASNSMSSPYWKQPATKSIGLALTGLDTRFPYYQIAAMKKTSDGGAINEVEVMEPVEIQTSSSTYVYTGYESLVRERMSLEEFLGSSLQRVEKARAHTSDINRLFIGNVENTTRDYSAFQRYASKIKVDYVQTGFQEREAKISNTYNIYKTLLHDEIYALGIVYIFKDGTQSPAFHIPGRPLDSVPPDSGYISPYWDVWTGWDSDDVTGDDNIFDASKTKRWQVYSTASIDPTSTTQVIRGHLGYYETPTTYPTITTCDGHADGYWGRDYEDNLIEPGVTKIRHHRMPAQWMYKDVGGSDYAFYSQYIISLKFTGIEFPDPDVVGYYIVYGDRSEDRTIVDNGYLSVMEYDSTEVVAYHAVVNWDNLTYLNDTENLTERAYAFVSPKTVLKSLPVAGDYLHIQKWVHTTSELTTDIGTVGANNVVINVPAFAKNLTCTTRIWEYKKMVRPDTRINYKIDGQHYLPKSVVQATDSTMPKDQSIGYFSGVDALNIENRSKQHNIMAFYLPEPLVEALTPATPGTGISANFDHDTVIASVKLNRDVFVDLSKIIYKRLHTNKYSTVSPSTLTAFGGDVIVSQFDLFNLFWDNSANVYSQFHTASVESEIVPEARLYSDADVGRYTFFRWNYEYDHDYLRRYIASKYYEPAANVEQFFDENYTYDEKYNATQVEYAFFPPNRLYDFCSTDQEVFPYRIYYSETDNAEESADKFRIIRANNYKDLDGDTGSITDLFKSFDKVYVTTDQAVYAVPTKPQTLQTSDATVYVGTGEVLSQPFVKLTNGDYPLVGSQLFTSRIVTEFGAFYVDTLSATPVLLTNLPTDISLKGMRNYWQNNGELGIVNQFKQLTDQDYPVLSTCSPVGAGYMSTYDPRFKRLIVYKKDFVIHPYFQGKFEYSPTTPVATNDVLWFDGDKYYYNQGGTSYEVYPDNSAYFEDRSFVISYSFIHNAWASFHSYRPAFMFNDYDTFFSTPAYQGGIYKHNKGFFQTYYDTKDPFIIDIIAKTSPLLIGTFNNLMYTSYTEYFDEFKKQWQKIDATFDGVIAYTSNQSTGYVDLDLKLDITPFSQDLLGNFAFVVKTDKTFRLSNLRDMTLSPNLPIWDSSWDALQAVPYMDKVPNEDNILYDKSMLEQARLKDHFVGARLFFHHPTENLRVVTDLITTAYYNKNR